MNDTTATPANSAPMTKRAITMADFRNRPAIAAAMGGKTTKLGHIIGSVYGSKEVIGKLKDGTETNSTVLTGDFECANFQTGEVFKSGSAYLPKYFAVQVAAQIAASRDGGVLFAIEVVMEPNPKSKDGEGVAYQYSVVNLIPPERNDPLEMLKARLGKKLAIPSFVPGRAIEGKGEEAETPSQEDEAPAPTDRKAK